MNLTKEVTMKVLMFNGSPNPKGNTATALAEMEKIFVKEGFECETITLGNQVIKGCQGCGACMNLGKCVNDDIVNECLPKLEAADALIIGSPVYFASANGTLISFLDRLFFAAGFDMTGKVGASVVVARRGGLSATFDELNKYFTISGITVASSCYWNSVHGRTPGEALADAEGMRTVRTLAKNVAFLAKSIALGKEKYGLPEKEPAVMTNFVREDLL